jgi:hypothetical protein
MSLWSRKGGESLSQGATTKRVTDANKGPIGKTALGACFRNLLGEER